MNNNICFRMQVEQIMREKRERDKARKKLQKKQTISKGKFVDKMMKLRENPEEKYEDRSN